MAFVNLIDIVYPVGSIYITASHTNPATTFGGSWSQIKTFLYGNGTLGSTGGEASTVLYLAHMPTYARFITTEYSNGAKLWTNDEQEYKIGGANYSLAYQSTATAGCYWANTNSVRGWWWYNGNEAWPNYYSGNGVAHNNLPPYTVVNIWQRTN